MAVKTERDSIPNPYGLVEEYHSGFLRNAQSEPQTLEGIQRALVEGTKHRLPEDLLTALGIEGNLNFVLIKGNSDDPERHPYVWMGVPENASEASLEKTVAVVEFSEHPFAVRVAGRDVRGTGRPIGLRLDANDMTFTQIDVGLLPAEAALISQEDWWMRKVPVPTPIAGGDDKTKHYAAALITAGMTQDGRYQTAVAAKRSDYFMTRDLGPGAWIEVASRTPLGEPSHLSVSLSYVFPADSHHLSSWRVEVPAFMEEVKPVFTLPSLPH